ncbi:MAG: ABC transporter ATP-binding protein [Pelagibacteraceae bacterium]|nr:ABC transporter ATP-binding protein [Pelagibacteraceae bacterium]MBT4951290.1 ABC transporter ATP-binding protein [Pelagibacteraceae bacterium]MBT6198441.1 ABC transporter ATP-binding protein [Pelagibacteraceae bacterium]
MENSVEVKKLSFNYGKVEILKNLDLNIKDGEFMVLLGPSGCGKTTLLNCIAGLLDLDEGQIWIEKDNVTWKEPKDRHIGMVFQSYALYPSMTVEKNLSFGLRMTGVEKSKIKEKINKVSELLQIGGLLHRKPSQLSGGQRQRVAIGRALVRDAKVFLFDEPLSNLDAKLRAELRYEIKKLHRDLGNTMIYVTHDQIEAMTLADRIAVMKNGVIQQLDSPKKIYNKPSSLFVADFIGSPSMNFFSGTFLSENNSFSLNKTTFILNEYQFENKPNDMSEIIFGIRPEDIRLKKSSESMEFNIELIEPMGADTLIWLSLENIPFSVRLDVSSEYKLGDVINIEFDIKRASIFDKKSELRL